MKTTTIEKLIEMGAKRWTKNGKDRLYLNGAISAIVKLEYSTYNTGNVSSATLGGEHISNSEARRILASASTMYIDLKNDGICGGTYAVAEAVREWVEREEVAEVEEVEEVEEAEETEEEGKNMKQFWYFIVREDECRTELDDMDTGSYSRAEAERMAIELADELIAIGKPEAVVLAAWDEEYGELAGDNAEFIVREYGSSVRAEAEDIVLFPKHYQH